MKLDKFHRFWLTIAVATGSLSPMSARAGDFSATAGAGLGMAIYFPFVLGLLTLVAPQGKRLLVFGLALVGLPLFANVMYSFIQALPDKEAGDLWFLSTALVAAAGLLVLILMRLHRLSNGFWSFSWNPAKFIAAVLLAFSLHTVYRVTIMFYSKTIDALPAIEFLAFHLTFIAILVNLWFYRSWAWWTVLAITLAGVANSIWHSPTLLLHANGWLALTPALLTLVLLLLPSTRRQCSRQAPDIAPSLH
jgi:hypothetical protein